MKWLLLLITYAHFIINWWYISVKVSCECGQSQTSLASLKITDNMLQVCHVITISPYLHYVVQKAFTVQAKLKITFASHHPHPHLFSWPMCWFYCILWTEVICDDLGKINCDFLMSNIEVFCWKFICTHKMEIISCQAQVHLLILVVHVSRPFL